jgi:F0F1-type ATP synthase assembly protein I
VDAEQKREFNAGMNESHGSFELVLSPLILALIGWFLDTRVTHTTPLLTVIFAVVGVVGATIKLFYTYRARMAELDAASPWAQRKGANA